MPQYTQQDTINHINGMTDVAGIVYQIINGEYFTDSINPEPLATIMQRQIQHLNLMLEMEHIQNSGADLQYFKQAKDDGNVWINNN